MSVLGELSMVRTSIDHYLAGGGPLVVPNHRAERFERIDSVPEFASSLEQFLDEIEPIVARFQPPAP